MKIRNIVLIFTITYHTMTLAENTTADSLINKISQTSKDTNLVNLYLKISESFFATNRDTAYYYDKCALKLATELKDTSSQLSALSGIANYYYYYGEYEKALNYYKNGLNITTKTNDTKGIAEYNSNIGNLYYVLGEYTKANKCYKTAFNLYKKINNTRGKARSKLQLGNVFYEQGKYKNAIANFNYVINLPQNKDIAITKADSYQNLGNVLSYMGDKAKALDNYLISAKLYEELGDNNRLSYCNYNIGIIHSNLQNYNNAEIYYKKALDVFIFSKNYRGEVYALMSLGEVKAYEKKYNKSIEYLFKAVNLGKEKGYSNALSKCYSKIGETYQKQKQWDNAEEYYQKALNIEQKIGDEDGISKTMCALASIKNENGNYYEAAKLAEHALEKILKMNIKTQESFAYLQISKAYEGLNKPIKALKYYKLYKIIDDSLITKAKHKQITELETKYKTAQKEKKIALLTSNNKTKDMALTKKRTKFIIVTGILIFVIFIVILIFLLNRIKSKKLSVELEQKLLRSQMNPHFIFNSLANIQTFIFNNQNDNALKYLSSFSSLTRNILENSRKEYVSLEEEVATLNYYLELQEIRFENKFDYKINIDTAIDPEEVFIPPMLAQPFIENAIQHGLINKKEKGHIRISFSMKNKNILFKVEDDGIGIEKSKEYIDKKHQSLATQITKERLKNYNKRIGDKIKFEMSDIVNNLKQVTGTSVAFLIPIKI